MPVCYVKPDGTISLLTIAAEYLATHWREGDTATDTVIRCAVMIQAKVPRYAGATVTTVRTQDVPTDRSERSKWRLQGGRVVVDPAAAVIA
jgi:hypothetical protein